MCVWGRFFYYLFFLTYGCVHVFFFSLPFQIILLNLQNPLTKTTGIFFIWYEKSGLHSQIILQLSFVILSEGMRTKKNTNLGIYN